MSRSNLAAILRAAVACGLVMSFSAVASARVRAGQRAVKLSHVTDAHGRRVSLRAYRHEVVVMTFGASWCAPCAHELPALEKLAREYAAKKAKVVFLAVNIDNHRKSGLAFVKRVGLKHVRAVFDTTKATVEAYDPAMMPTIYIIGPRGLVRDVHGGYHHGDMKKIAADINRLLPRAH